MSAESAQRAALGAGAIVMDSIATNDGRLPHEKIARIRELSPDMIVLSGGTDGGTISHVVEQAEYIAAARPRPRLGKEYKVPVVFAGNVEARDEVREVLEDITALHVTENLRPVLERENLEPCRNTIQELFLEHVMAHAPGYDKLMEWTSAPIRPTPGAVGEMMQTLADEEEMNLVGADIGGATTDVFSVMEGQFNRTVSANLGMSYSISNVLAEAGPKNAQRWMLNPMGEDDMNDRVKNKMIRPTTIPQTMDELMMEQSLAREALRLGFNQHKRLATGLKGVRRERDISEAFWQTSAESLVDMQTVDLLMGSGGALSHAPRRAQSMAMMIDAFRPEGLTRLGVDSIFMMPHLGVLSAIDREAALEVFHRDCLVMLGSCIAPSGTLRWGKKALEYRVSYDGGTEEGELAAGEMLRLPETAGRTCRVVVEPRRGLDVGAGRSTRLEAECPGGEVGLIFDARGRPLELPEETEEEARHMREWARALSLYPEGVCSR